MNFFKKPSTKPKIVIMKEKNIQTKGPGSMDSKKVNASHPSMEFLLVSKKHSQ